MLLGTWVSRYADYCQAANMIGDVRRFGQDLGEPASPKICRHINVKVVAKGNVGVNVPFTECGEDWMAWAHVLRVLISSRRKLRT